mmetsp:Transcript_12939/g.33710  ORF Transcript_12939/g.33710 Transcript_12939/m.33710 type:complete len:354 (+) Transcript_12939:197-1258(+)
MAALVRLSTPAAAFCAARAAASARGAPNRPVMMASAFAVWCSGPLRAAGALAAPPARFTRPGRRAAARGCFAVTADGGTAELAAACAPPARAVIATPVPGCAWGQRGARAPPTLESASSGLRAERGMTGGENSRSSDAAGALISCGALDSVPDPAPPSLAGGSAASRPPTSMASASPAEIGSPMTGMSSASSSASSSLRVGASAGGGVGWAASACDLPRAPLGVMGAQAGGAAAGAVAAGVTDGAVATGVMRAGIARRPRGPAEGTAGAGVSPASAPPGSGAAASSRSRLAVECALPTPLAGAPSTPASATRCVRLYSLRGGGRSTALAPDGALLATAAASCAASTASWSSPS